MTAKSGQSTPRQRKFGPRPPRDVLPRPQPPQLDHRRVRDREREHRAERVHRAEEVRLAREEDEDRDEAGEDDRATIHGVLNFGCSRRKIAGSCR